MRRERPLESVSKELEENLHLDPLTADAIVALLKTEGPLLVNEIREKLAGEHTPSAINNAHILLRTPIGS